MGSAERQGALWSAAPRDWAERQEPFCRPLWDDTLAALGAGAGFRLLDAGCGGGGAAVVAANLGCRVTGLDASAGLLAIARERLPAAQFLTGDLEHLPFAEGGFDGVLAANSVIFAENIPAAMRELRRVVRSGGRVVITTWGRWRVRCLLALTCCGSTLREILRRWGLPPTRPSVPMPALPSCCCQRQDHPGFTDPRPESSRVRSGDAGARWATILGATVGGTFRKQRLGGCDSRLAAARHGEAPPRQACRGGVGRSRASFNRGM